jgi:alcohol dehydrogenase (cytochrome c)
MSHVRVTFVVSIIAAVALPAIVAVQSVEDGRKHSGRNWPAPGGDWGTSRYSTASWVVELPDRESSRAFPIISDGLMFLTTNRGRILALDPATGKTVWSYSHPGYGGNRGVGAGEGLLFAGMGDSTVIAVDQKTGQLRWMDSTARSGAAGTGHDCTARLRRRRGRGYRLRRRQLRARSRHRV